MNKKNKHLFYIYQQQTYWEIDRGLNSMDNSIKENKLVINNISKEIKDSSNEYIKSLKKENKEKMAKVMNMNMFRV